MLINGWFLCHGMGILQRRFSCIMNVFLFVFLDQSRYHYLLEYAFVAACEDMIGKGVVYSRDIVSFLNCVFASASS